MGELVWRWTHTDVRVGMMLASCFLLQSLVELARVWRQEAVQAWFLTPMLLASLVVVGRLCTWTILPLMRLCGKRIERCTRMLAAMTILVMAGLGFVWYTCWPGVQNMRGVQGKAVPALPTSLRLRAFFTVFFLVLLMAMVTLSCLGALGMLIVMYVDVKARLP